MADLPTGTITYLFSDVEGSTRLWQQHPEEMRAVMARHDALLTSEIERSGGAVVRSRGEGDSIFSVFVRATDAGSAACGIQQALLREIWPADISIHVRMALHTGESELREHDYYGTTVNRCAHLRGIAHGGQVILSETTAQLVQDTLPEEVSLQDMGAHRLKDLQRPEHVFQLIHPGLPADFPALKSLDAHLHNLPVQLTSFIGREEEIDDVSGLLSSARLVTLAGTGGSGKTRLSQEIGASVIDNYPDGVWFIGLAPLSDPNMLRPHVADTFSVGEDALNGFLQRKSILVILDNCEHLVAGAASLVQWLLSSPGVTVMATSREALNLAGERIFQVPPLPVPVQDSADVIMAGCPSVDLFIERAQAANPAFQLTAGNAASVNRIVQRIDGIPQPRSPAALKNLSNYSRAGRSMSCRTIRPSRAALIGATTCWTRSSRCSSASSPYFGVASLSPLAAPSAEPTMSLRSWSPWASSWINRWCVPCLPAKRPVTTCWSRCVSTPPPGSTRTRPRRREAGTRIFSGPRRAGCAAASWPNPV